MFEYIIDGEKCNIPPYQTGHVSKVVQRIHFSTLTFVAIFPTLGIVLSLLDSCVRIKTLLCVRRYIVVQ